MEITRRLRVVAALAVLLTLATSAQAATYYIVIGSFSEEQRAAKFAESVRGFFPDPGVTTDAVRSVFYVYALRTNVLKEAEEYRKQLATRKGFANGWIHANFDDAGTQDAVESSTGGIALELYTGNTIFLSSNDNTILSVSKHGAQTRTPEQWAGETPFTFGARNRSGLALSGKVSLIRGGEAASSFKTGEIASFGGQQRTMTLLCEVPGYSPAVRQINIAQLGSDPEVAANKDGIWQVVFTLTRMKTDEISLLYHEWFHENAAVLRPSAKEALDALASMMKADASVRISINSHCNPRDTRELRVAGKDGNSFNIDGSQLQSGSDKQLTKLRADCVRDYLVGQGINRERISVMGWGPLNMIVTGPERDQSVNDRIEVDFLKN